jgi:Bacterial Ig domain
MTALGRAAVGASLVLFLPGTLIAALLRMRFRELTTWAAIPVFSLAAVFVLGEFTNLVHVPFGIPAFAVLVTALALGLLARRRLLPSETIGEQLGAQNEKGTPWRDRVGPERLTSYCLLAVGIAIGLLTWAQGLRGVALGPARNDGSHHAFFVARIVETQALDYSQVLLADPRGPTRALEFYPLGTHASAAIATPLVDADIGRMLIVFTVLFAAVVLPLGMFVLARMLAPHRPLVAGFAAMTVPLLSIFPYQPSTWGGVALIVGMAMVPVSVVLLSQAVMDRETSVRAVLRLVVTLIPAALALLAGISVHTTQVPLVVFLVGLLVLERAWRTRSTAIVLNAAVRGAVAIALMAVLFAPALLHARGGLSERYAINVTPTTDVSDALRRIFTLHMSTPSRQAVLAVLAVLGAVIWLLTSRRFAWLAGWLTIFVLTLLASTSKDTISQALTLPWYHVPQRVNFNQVFFVTFFAAVALASAVTGTVRVLRSRQWLVPVAAVFAAVFIAIVGLHGYRNTREMLHDAYTAQGVRPESLRAYSWLARHADTNDTVVNDGGTDGSLWMYPHARLNPLFGFPVSRSQSDQSQRQFLRNNIASAGRDPSVDAAARGLQARWIYLDELTYPGTEHILDLDALRRNPRISEVFHVGTVHIFKITISAPEVDRIPPATTIVGSEPPVAGPLSGRTTLVASASDDVRVDKVEFRASGGALSDKLIGTARNSFYGWLYNWNTTAVPNGTYTLTTVAVDTSGNSASSVDHTIVVQNESASDSRKE